MTVEPLIPADQRRSRIAARQRARRAKLRRIDYYPSEAAISVIDCQYRMGVIGGDTSSVINGIVEEWAAERRLGHFYERVA